MSEQAAPAKAASTPETAIIDPAPGHGWWSLIYYGLPFAVTLGISYLIDSSPTDVTFKWGAIFGIVAFIASIVLASLHRLYAVNRSDLRGAGRWYAADLSDERNIAVMIGIWFTLVGIGTYLDYFGIDILSQDTTVANILNAILTVLQAPFVVVLWLASIIATPGVLLIVGALAFWSGIKQHAQRNAGQKGLSFQTWLLFAAVLGAFILSLEPYIGALLPLY